jgi:hypothetical protein
MQKRKETAMFEKRLQAFTWAVGITFIILAVITVTTYFWFLLLVGGAFRNIPAFGALPATEMAEYMLDLKLFSIVIGTVFIICSLWRRKLKALG